MPVESYDAGAVRVLDGTTDVFFGDRPILMETAAESPSASDLIVLDRVFTSEPIALTLAEERRRFSSGRGSILEPVLPVRRVSDLYAKWFGAPDDAVMAFFRQSALPE